MYDIYDGSKNVTNAEAAAIFGILIPTRLVCELAHEELNIYMTHAASHLRTNYGWQEYIEGYH